MPRQVKLHKLESLALKETPNEILIDTTEDTELHISIIGNTTIIRFPFSNKFDILDGIIFIKNKI